MRLTSFTDYGLRALMRAAAEPARMFTTIEIATEFAISRDHLTKIVRALAKAGFIATQRGAAGGFRLARPPEAIVVGEVVRALEPDEPLAECFRKDGGACVMTPTCALRRPISKARDAFLNELDALTLAECAYPGARTAGSLSPP